MSPPNPAQLYVRKLAENPSALIQRTVYHAAEIQWAGRIFETGDTSTNYVDVPVRNLLGLVNVVSGRETWRKVANKLSCPDWKIPDVTDYFDHPIKERWFPGANSLLDLYSYGSAAYVSNGNHRAILGVLYLVGKHGDTAVFPEVKCTRQPLNVNGLRVVRGLVRSHPGVSIYAMRLRDGRPFYFPKKGWLLLFEATTTEKSKVYHFDGTTAKEVFSYLKPTWVRTLKERWGLRVGTIKSIHDLPDNRRASLLDSHKFDPAFPAKSIDDRPPLMRDWVRIQPAILEHLFQNDIPPGT